MKYKQDAQLIIELAKLRDKLYEFEDKSSEKVKFENKVSKLEEKLKNAKSTNDKLNYTVKNILLDNILKISEKLNEFKETNDKTLLDKAMKELNTSIKKINDLM